jgi:hypothetical protein
VDGIDPLAALGVTAPTAAVAPVTTAVAPVTTTAVSTVTSLLP